MRLPRTGLVIPHQRFPRIALRHPERACFHQRAEGSRAESHRSSHRNHPKSVVIPTREPQASQEESAFASAFALARVGAEAFLRPAAPYISTGRPCDRGRAALQRRVHAPPTNRALSSRASRFCDARDVGEPCDAARTLRRINRTSGSHPYQPRRPLRVRISASPVVVVRRVVGQNHVNSNGRRPITDNGFLRAPGFDRTGTVNSFC